PKRYATLARAINTTAPNQTFMITSPAGPDGSILVQDTNQPLQILTCFSLTVATNNAQNIYFTILINGVFQPRTNSSGGPAYLIATSSSCSGLRSLTYNWLNPTPGTNAIQVIFTNQVYLSD